MSARRGQGENPRGLYIGPWQEYQLYKTAEYHRSHRASAPTDLSAFEPDYFTGVAESRLGHASSAKASLYDERGGVRGPGTSVSLRSAGTAASTASRRPHWETASPAPYQRSSTVAMGKGSTIGRGGARGHRASQAAPTAGERKLEDTKARLEAMRRTYVAGARGEPEPSEDKVYTASDKQATPVPARGGLPAQTASVIALKAAPVPAPAAQSQTEPSPHEQVILDLLAQQAAEQARVAALLQQQAFAAQQHMYAPWGGGDPSGASAYYPAYPAYGYPYAAPPPVYGYYAPYAMMPQPGAYGYGYPPQAPAHPAAGVNPVPAHQVQATAPLETPEGPVSTDGTVPSGYIAPLPPQAPKTEGMVPPPSRVVRLRQIFGQHHKPTPADTPPPAEGRRGSGVEADIDSLIAWTEGLAADEVPP